ncbi:MAG: hypothetical protein AXA67_06920 [Methylothermaceae bacteria B42]|nr:MAG: hypothetical protein AXA67_06920 [Methylothermaceae bacteria B42]HHJ40244.1 cytochrome c1 [Methylothermaceae bacterium]
MKHLIFALFLSLPRMVAAELTAPLQTPDLDIFDTESLQRGAKLYGERCIGCHSLKHMRYKRIQKDLKLSDDELKNLFPWLDKPIGTLSTAMPSEDAEKWFGLPTPDLSERIRARGADWVYTFLRSFYQDEERPFGVNNWVFRDVGMPHVLWDLQGMQKAVIKEKKGTPTIVKLQQVSPGTLSKTEFDRAVTDLVNFLNYVAEPAQLDRLKLGKYVLFYLIILAFIMYRLKKAYWKEIH